MDSLDIRLLRALCLDGKYTLRGIDPRCSVQELAQKVRASRITVSRRLARWRATGFWKGVVAYPNPDVLGVRFQMQPVILEVGRNRARLERALRDVLEPFMTYQIENFYGPLLLSERSNESTRRQRAFAKASGCRGIAPLFELVFVRSEVPLRRRDWRILKAIRKSPDLDWPRIAQEVEMTVRALDRRVVRLMQANAIFFTPLLDFRRLAVSVAWVGLLYGPEVNAARFRDQLIELHPDALLLDPLFPFEVFLPPVDPPQFGGGVLFFLAVSSGSSVDQLRRDFSGLPGVVEALVAFPTQNTTLPQTFDRLIQVESERARPSGRTKSRRTRPRA